MYSGFVGRVNAPLPNRLLRAMTPPTGGSAFEPDASDAPDGADALFGEGRLVQCSLVFDALSA